MDVDIKRVRILTNRIRQACKDDHPVNTIPAMQTFTVQELVRASPNYEIAMKGLAANYADMSLFLKKHYTSIQ